MGETSPPLLVVVLVSHKKLYSTLLEVLLGAPQRGLSPENNRNMRNFNQLLTTNLLSNKLFLRLI